MCSVVCGVAGWRCGRNRGLRRRKYRAARPKSIPPRHFPHFPTISGNSAPCGARDAVATAAGGVVESGASGTETAPPAPMSPFVASLSPHLFWDVDREQVDPEKHRRSIIQRVLERGSWDDWKAVKAEYTLPSIVEEARNMRSLEPTALAFVSCVGHVPKESFRCCSSKPSNLPPWPC